MKPLLIAVVGGSASGKTTLALDLIRALQPGSALLLSQDSFYRSAAHLPPARRDQLNFDHPRRIDWPLLSQAIHDVLARRAAAIPRYSFERHAREDASDVLPPCRFLVLEGLWLLRRRDIRSRCAYRIFVTCPSAERLQRRIRRDVADRGRDRKHVLRQWRTQSEPGFRRFVLPQRDHADVVVRSPVPPGVLSQLVGRIRSLSEEQP